MATGPAARSLVEVRLLDGLVHSLAFANPETALGGKFLSTPWSDVGTALQVSAYSLASLTMACKPLLVEPASVVGLTFDATVSWPVYDWMGVSKAALESTTRYLAFELGEKKIRLNTLSAGPVRTLSAMAVGGIDEMFAHVEKKAPLKRNIDGDEVGKAAVNLLSDLSSGITGQNLYVDAGFSIVGI